jgi:hypothetical protein
MTLDQKRKEAHEANLDLAYAEIEKRDYFGEDMSNAWVDPVTYEIKKGAKND